MLEDFEKIQYREYQRQKLLEELKRLVYDKVDDLDNIGTDETGFYYGLVVSSIDYTRDVHGSDQKAGFRHGANFFDEVLLPKIEEFTPVKAERKLLAGELLKFAIDSILQPVNRKILQLSVPPARDEFLRQIGLDKLEDLP